MHTNPTSGQVWDVPRDMAPFVAKCPRLLPGESEEDYHALFHMMILEIEPQTAVEWLVVADITGLCWEIYRYRGWKGAILNTYRTQAIETALRAAHDPGAIVGVPTVADRARKEAEEWCTDPVKREAINARLAKHGYDEEALNAGAMLEAIEPLAKMERFLASARGQLNVMLKEIHVRRRLVERVFERQRKALNATKPKAIGSNKSSACDLRPQA
jgi:hypothetical protein